jgi:hypothetical protein
MSWQRILESARRNGFPVIVTDIAGREPMVVMPFDAFEEMNEAYHTTIDQWEGGLDEVEYSDVPESESSEAPWTEEGADPNAAPVAQEAAPTPESNKTASDHWPESSTEEDVSHLSMEDRFYLEPVDEDAN